MSRIRTIKPEFWTSAQVIECSPNARLLFIGLWNFCDDNGRHPASARQVKAEIFPADELSLDYVSGLLDELLTNGLIKRYTVDSIEYFVVTGWRHQRIDKPQKPKYPEPIDDHSRNVRGIVDERSTTIPALYDTIGYDRIGSDCSVADKPREDVSRETEKEPEKETPTRTREWFARIETEIREAAGLENDPSPSLCDVSPIVRRLDKGADFARDVLPVLRRFKAAKKLGRTWEYYGAAIDEGAVKLAAIPQRSAPAAVAAIVWLDQDDPRYPAARDAHTVLIGLPPPLGGSRYENGIGSHFPVACLAKKVADA